MSKRLEMLEKLAASANPDSFTLYALALEYKSANRIDDSLRTFERLRDKDPLYVPMYLMAGAMLQANGRPEPARQWLRLGIERAREKGDSHAASEMSDILEQLGD